jgi:hypothetical protein
MGVRTRVAASLALLLAAGGLISSVPEARAHGTITPAEAPTGTKQRFEIQVPNTSVNVPITGFRLTAPAGVDLRVVDARDWSTMMEGSTLVWLDGSVDAGATGVFAFEADLPNDGTTITFQGEEVYPSVPRSGLFPLQVSLVSRSPPPGKEDRSLGPLVVASVLAITTLAAIAATGFLRRRDRQRADRG